MRARPLVFALLLALPAFAFPQYKPWYNFYNFTYGAKARAMGNAFSAVADDLTAAFWNPAGLAALRNPEFYLGYKTTSQRHDYDLQNNAPAGEPSRLYNFNFASKLNQIDFFSLSAPATLLGRPCTFALGYYRYIPYGFKGTAQEILTFLRSQKDSLRTTVTFTGSEGFDVLAFSASASLNDYFSLGATLQQFFGSGSLQMVRVEQAGEFHSQLSEKVQGRNIIAGALFTPFRQLRLGCTWHSGLNSDLASTLLTWEVDANGQKSRQEEVSCQARVVIPEQFALGVLLRLSAWLDLSAEYSRLDWDKGTIENYYQAVTALPYPQKDAVAFGQKQARNWRFGGEARMPFRSWQLSLRGGISLDRQLYADVSGVAVKVKGYAAGIGWQFSPNFLVEITYQRQVADWQEDGFVIQAPDVTTHFRANVFLLALTYRFGHFFKE